MANAEENAKTPVLPKPNQSPKDEVSQTSSSHPNNGTSSLKKTLSQKEFILSAAAKIASQTLHFSDPDVWAVLTAISDNARKRHQVISETPTKGQMKRNKELSSLCCLVYVQGGPCSSTVNGNVIPYTKNRLSSHINSTQLIKARK